MRAVMSSGSSIGHGGGDECGLSLIELIVVTVIFAILVAIAVPLYINVQQDSRNTAAEAAAANAVAEIAAQMAQHPRLAPDEVDTTSFTHEFGPHLVFEVSGSAGAIATICVRIASGGGVDASHLVGGDEEIAAGPCPDRR